MENSVEIINVNQASMLEALNRAEVDMQISTAKAYPRDVEQSLRRIKELATIDSDTAENCFYALQRGGELIEGISVRFAEIVASQWGNLRVQARIVGNDGKFITVQGVAQDLETNFAASVEVKRRITDRNGKTYSDDMQVVTGNAAAAIAFRNAVMKVVPYAVTHRIAEEVRNVAKGKALSLEQRVSNMLKWYESIGVSRQQVLSHIGVKSADAITEEKADYLRGLAVAIKEGGTTVKETFGDVTGESNAIAEEVRKKAEEAKQKAAQAVAKSQGKSTSSTQKTAKNEQEKVNKETGEVIKL